MTDFDASRAATVLRVIASVPRLAILRRLLDGECAVATLETGLGIRQPGLSQHLGALREAGLVTSRREARAVFYRLAGAGAHHLVASVLSGVGRPMDLPEKHGPVPGAGPTARPPAPAPGVARFARLIS